ncbi:hypothetical protein PFICI_09646 [Pestalotiopsis fici W106-1]|uniref:Uncharacterized protein n=1 Tax=Pestalotiopsis fici (strain W106-1 / CGMCC3.15140) TaxID=1229662 RepID=W3X101_PESFW|nr:uncharacterized protein PFICI_09646 [Pestalotiopsis fici W106-1]ETS79793.1 hypothetical protein PFICI_09646 [Pestalotiopsis fici W106-1]
MHNRGAFDNGTFCNGWFLDAIFANLPRERLCRRSGGRWERLETWIRTRGDGQGRGVVFFHHNVQRWHVSASGIPCCSHDQPG